MERPQDDHGRERAESNTSLGNDKGTPACQSCRKRKLKCSRDSPLCAQCARLGCTCRYDHNKQKPGIKSGAIESLNRRLEFLEKLLLDGGGIPKVGLVPSDQPGCVYHASLLLAKELEANVKNPGRGFTSGVDVSDGSSHRNCLQETEFVFGGGDQTPSSTRPSKKRKGDHNQCERDLLERNWNNAEDIRPSLLPSVRVLNLVVDVFYSTIHPWIPFIHLDRFREQFNDAARRPDLEIILHAMVFATMKYLKEADTNMEQSEIASQVQMSRNVVMLIATDRMSLHNIQALIIVAFHDIGSGNISRAWPIIGSLTRIVEYLQLTVEADETLHYSLLTPLVLLDKPLDWTESENRRRIFWNVFLLDRYCSITTGWNTSFTSDDVRRRLPCDGGLWQHREEAVVTPFFGIWNKSAATIGNSIAYMPVHYSSPDHPVDHRSPNGISDFGPVDRSKLGAFAYHIEATESLSQVTTFFLQQKVDFRNRQEAGSWLTRFKELDLRLVHWKMFLPQKWKDSNISRDKAFINMDPNLTLAHITHNTSMILLHQHIAYPPLEWAELIRLPSSCSAGTCESAAIETASISEKYLKYTDIGVVSSQFALCAFVAARVLLVHWQYYQTALHPEFFGLLASIKNMSARWRGIYPEVDMAGQYVLYLQTLHRQCTDSPDFRMDANLSKLLPPMVLQSSPGSSVPSPSLAEGLAPKYRFQRQNNSVQSQAQPDSAQRTQNPQSQTQPQSSYYANQTFYTSSDMHSMSPGSAALKAQSTSLPFQDQLQFQSQLQSQPHATDNFSPSPQYPAVSAYFSTAPRASASNLSLLHNTTALNERMRHSDNSNSIIAIPNGISLVVADDNKSIDEHEIDSLTEMSKFLQGQQFLEMDRVITLEETDFTVEMDLEAWGGS